MVSLRSASTLPSPFNAGDVLSRTAVIVWQGSKHEIVAPHPEALPLPLDVNVKVKHPVGLIVASEAVTKPGLAAAPPPVYVPKTGAVVSI